MLSFCCPMCVESEGVNAKLNWKYPCRANRIGFRSRMPQTYFRLQTAVLLFGSPGSQCWFVIWGCWISWDNDQSIVQQQQALELLGADAKFQKDYIRTSWLEWYLQIEIRLRLLPLPSNSHYQNCSYTLSRESHLNLYFSLLNGGEHPQNTTALIGSRYFEMARQTAEWNSVYGRMNSKMRHHHSLPECETHTKCWNGLTVSALSITSLQWPFLRFPTMTIEWS